MLLKSATQPSRVSLRASCKQAPPSATKPVAKQSVKHADAGLMATAGALLAAAPAMAEEAAGEAAPMLASPPPPAPVAAQSASESAFDTAVDSLISAVQASGTVIKSVDDAILTALDVARKGYDTASPVLNDLVKTASPVVQQAWNTAAGALGPTFQSFQQEAGKAVQSQLPSNLGDTTKEASSAFSSVKPFFDKFVQYITSSEPITLGEYAIAFVAFLYIAPALVGVLRGYSDDLPSAAALNLLVNEGETVLIDIRSSKEKEASGVPDLPSSAASRSTEVEFAVTEDKKLRSQLRNVTGIESEITALQIASLKKVNKNTKIILLDKNGSTSKIVAKELTRKGYPNVYVIDGGFDGRGGWVQSKLQIKPAVSLPAPSKGLGSMSTRPGTRGSRVLPAPKN